MGAGRHSMDGESRRMTGKRVVILDIPAPCAFINSNDRTHRMAQAKLTKTWRAAAKQAAANVAPLTPPVHITAHIWKPRGGRYDPGNLYPTAKALVDGLVDAGIFADDDHKHVIGPDMRHGGIGNPEIILEITERKA